MRNASILPHGLRAAAFITILAAAMCWTSHPSSSSPHAAVTVTDMAGRVITIPAPPQRIISTSPGVTEILFSLGLNGRIAGVTSHCNYPPEARNLPSIGSMHPGIEKIVQLRPDLIVVDRSLKIDSAARLEKMGYRLLTVDCSVLQSFRQSLLLLGQATGKEEKARELKRTLDEGIHQVAAKLGTMAPIKKTRVFVEIWDKPLMTAGANTYFNDLITLSGGENVFADTKDNYPKVNLESLIERDPQVIILTTSKKDELLKKASWSRMKAVQKRQVFEINPDIIARPTLRMLVALDMMARWLHPEAFAQKKNTLSRTTL